MAAFNRYLTVSDILNKAAVECGLVASADPYASTDASFVQMRTLLGTVGLELLTVHDWQQLRREATKTISYGGASSFALEADFDRLIDQTIWDAEGNQVVGGPLNAQEWQAFKGLNISTTIPLLNFRFTQDSFLLYPNVPAGSGTYATVRYEYISRAWVQDGTDPLIFRDNFLAGEDIVLFDALLMVKSLKLRFLGAKGFSTADAAAQVANALQAAIGKTSPGEVLCVAPRGPSDGASLARTIG